MSKQGFSTSPSVRKKERLHYIDFMKGVCIILIVGIHVDDRMYSPEVNNVLQSFRVPLYYFLSGLFFKQYGGFGDFVRRKTNNIIIPFAFFYLMACAMAMVLTTFLHLDRKGLVGDTFQWQYIFDPFFARDFHYSVALWFLLSLFWVNVIYYVMKRYLSQLFLCVGVVILSVAGWILAYYKIILPMMLDTALVSMPFFFLGNVMKSKGCLKPRTADRWGGFVFAAVLVLLWFTAQPLNIFNQQLPNYLLMYSLTFLAIVSFFWFAKSLPRIPVVSYIGQFSLIVLGTHSLILTPIRKAVYMVTGETYCGMWIVLGVVFAVELILIPVFTRIFPKFTAQKPLIPLSERMP